MCWTRSRGGILTEHDGAGTTAYEVVGVGFLLLLSFHRLDKSLSFFGRYLSHWLISFLLSLFIIQMNTTSDPHTAEFRCDLFATCCCRACFVWCTGKTMKGRR
ncbi:uncharacterized protein B0T23DRAFT_154897 [Neurospora hispaniola]|uniref:Uncharacterized protein n=1 Tax=Neurospora hispaniola TaxID=588809 RepID=A0AAJ0I900_9PEZI|nr:hypothetical protein B0T23DRAFT_154897 [Neurospora hispaniola]